MELKLIKDDINFPTKMLSNLKMEDVIFIFVVSKTNSFGH